MYFNTLPVEINSIISSNLNRKELISFNSIVGELSWKYLVNSFHSDMKWCLERVTVHDSEFKDLYLDILYLKEMKTTCILKFFKLIEYYLRNGDELSVIHNLKSYHLICQIYMCKMRPNLYYLFSNNKVLMDSIYVFLIEIEVFIYCGSNGDGITEFVQNGASSQFLYEDGEMEYIIDNLIDRNGYDNQGGYIDPFIFFLLIISANTSELNIQHKDKIMTIYEFLNDSDIYYSGNILKAYIEKLKKENHNLFLELKDEIKL